MIAYFLKYYLVHVLKYKNSLAVFSKMTPDIYLRTQGTKYQCILQGVLKTQI